MSEKISLDERSEDFKGIQQEWREKAKKTTIDTLPDFLKELTENYRHDYGTICHAVAQAAIAAAHAVDHSPTGGITGFQAGCIMWQFIREWNCSDNKTGLKLVNYDKFLYPQYSDHFQKTIDKSVWTAIQCEARAKITEAQDKYAQYLIDLEKYKKDIATFITKYPDYPERKEYYEPLGMGTGEQWAAEEEKRASGFEFAPTEPHCWLTSESPVYRHWQSIVAGHVPFGYIVTSE